MIHSNKKHADLARKMMVSGRITQVEYRKCLLLDNIINRKYISSCHGRDKLFPGRALQKKVDQLLGLPCNVNPRG